MYSSYLKQPRIRSHYLIIAIAVFFMAFTNVAFFRHLLNDYPFNTENISFLFSVIVGFTGVIVLVLGLLCHRYTFKPIVIILLLVSSANAYFMDNYNTPIDDNMITNALSTDAREVRDLLSPTFFLYFILLGVLPSWLVYRTDIVFHPLTKEAWSRSKMIALTLLIMAGVFFLNSATFSSFFREHKLVRYYFNPANYVVGLARHVIHSFRDENVQITELGTDAAIPESDVHRELIIFVVGETARADHFSLNGYAKETNPLLSQEKIVSFTDFISCGTSTAISVPCMFSAQYTRDYDASTSASTENVLDVLVHAGVNVLWRDNNSSSKGVANRVPYEDFRDSKVNTICDVECRDEGMLVGLQAYIDDHPSGDIIIVLHQMGNHGPAYYKRYPKAFETYTPACHTNELSECSSEEIENAYDNAILYTDYFLHKTIQLLKRNDDTFETAMFYVSDHGESLGEHGLYLHGMPNFMAPDSQRHVPAILWLGKNFDEISFEDLYAKRDQHFTHDNVFHTLLNLMEVESKAYDPRMSLLE